MRLFHISDLLSVTTHKLLSTRGMDGLREILCFLTGEEEVFTHSMPRIMYECEPWMNAQFPQLMQSCPFIKSEVDRMTTTIEAFDTAAEPKQSDTKERPSREEMVAFRVAIAADFVERVRIASNLPEMIPVFEMGADMHLQLDPVEELGAMMGDKNVIVVRTGGQ